MAKDISDIARVVNAAFEVERPMRKQGNRTSVEQVSDLMERDTFFVAEQEGRVIGSVLVRMNGTTGYFGMLAVNPAVQRGGVGRALREHAESFCRERGCTEMTLTTGEFRTELIPYYARAGYRVVDTEPGPAEWRLDKPFRIVHMAKAL